MNPKIKRIITREGLIFSTCFILAYVSDVYISRIVPPHPNRPIGFLKILLIICLLILISRLIIHFIIWAVRKLKGNHPPQSKGAV